MTETKVREQYNRMAAAYDSRWSGYIDNTLSFLKNWAEIPSTATILDLACGTGELARLLLKEQPTQQIVGIDISEKMLAIAREKLQNYPNVSFAVASASALPFANNSFDVIVSANAFHYFEDPDAALKEMKRVLKPKGQVIILDWCKDYLFCQICDFFLKIFDPAYQKCYTQVQFHHLLNKAKFKIHCNTKVRLGWVWGLMAVTATPDLSVNSEQLKEKVRQSLS